LRAATGAGEKIPAGGRGGEDPLGDPRRAERFSSVNQDARARARSVSSFLLLETSCKPRGGFSAVPAGEINKPIVASLLNVARTVRTGIAK